jgi:hypothetical protein
MALAIFRSLIRPRRSAGVSAFGAAVGPRRNCQAMAQNIKIHREILFN